MTHINDLPREILLQIFSYYLKTETQRNFIRSIANVCQYWKEISMDSSLWHTFDGTLSLKDLKKYSKMGCLKDTESLVFSYSKRTVTIHELQLIYKNLPRLKFINFSKLIEQAGKGKWNFLFLIVNFCPNLQDIVFHETQSLIPPKFPSRLFSNFLKVHGSNLISLDISNLTILYFSGVFVRIASCCPNLECLKAQNLRGFRLIFPIQKVQNGLKKLKVLCLGHRVKMENCISVPSSGFPHLDTFIHASDIMCFIDDLELKELLMKSPDLKVLDIRGCALLTSSALCSLPANNLEKLYVSNTRLYELNGFANVIKKWGHSLVALDVSQMKGSSINRLFKSLILHNSLKNLESLDLNNTVVTMSTVKLIIQNCPNLNFIQLQSCRSFGSCCKHEYHGQEEIKQLLNLLDDIEADSHI